MINSRIRPNFAFRMVWRSLKNQLIAPLLAMNLQKIVPSALVIVVTLICAGIAIQAAELESDMMAPASIGALVVAGLLAGVLFGENVYSGIKGLVILAELVVGFLIVLFVLLAGETQEDAEESTGAEALGGVVLFILLIVIILILLALAVALVAGGVIMAIGGWIGV
ncbi:MAG: hypothetical protein ACFFGZ_16240, partial [Candidatus Thorarchaeota archaeon]